jgi:HEAT repeat protein
MAKPRSTETKLARLRELRNQPASPQLLEQVRAALRDPSYLVAADAAEIAGELRLTELVPTMVETYERFLDQPEKKDKQCRAKIAVATALNQLECTDEDFYLRGVRYVQLEPVWGGSQDTAVPVRVECAFGLVRNRHAGVLPILVDMLADPEKAARVGAARALAATGKEAAALLLRLKARLGDPDPEVMSECLGGILELNGEEGVPFVAEFLVVADEGIQEAALLALGGSRQPAAFDVLRAFAQKRADELREVAYLAIALLRLSAATDYLLTLVTDPSAAVARAALSALAVHRHDPRVCERAAAAVAQSGDASLRALFEKRFQGKD